MEKIVPLHKVQIFVGILLCITMMASLSVASPILQESGEGASGVLAIDISGTVYNALFRDDACTSLFATCSATSDNPFTFNTDTDATLAAQALRSALAVLLPTSDITRIIGIEFTGGSVAALNTPFDVAFNADLGGDFVFAKQVFVGGGEWLSGSFGTAALFDPDQDLSLSAAQVYVDWEIATTAVPSPSAFFLLVTGVLLHARTITTIAYGSKNAARFLFTNRCVMVNWVFTHGQRE